MQRFSNVDLLEQNAVSVHAYLSNKRRFKTRISIYKQRYKTPIEHGLR